MRRTALLTFIVVSGSLAQEKPLPAADRSIPVGQQQPASTLPPFDLPEFIITGRESIELPVAEKRQLDSAFDDGQIRRPVTNIPVRTQSATAEASMHAPVRQSGGSSLARAYLGIGSYSTFLLGLQAAGAVDELHLQGDVEYANTAGFAPNTAADRMRLSGGLRAPTSLFSGFVGEERVSAAAAFKRKAYAWYGSSSPGSSRSLAFASGGVRMGGVLSNGTQADLAISYKGGTVSDSTARVTEGTVGLAGDLTGNFLGLPTMLHAGMLSGGKSGGTGGSYGGLDAAVGVRWDPIDLLSTNFSVGIASVSGEAGQRKTVFLPGFSAAFSITPSHRFVGSFAPRVRFQDMESLTEVAPYLDASYPVRHTIIRNAGSIGVESDWSSALRSSVALETSTSGDYPVVWDSAGSGVFIPFYEDVTQTALRVSVVAKLPANHYFWAIAIVRSSKSSTSGLSVPYIPSSELRVSYKNILAEQLLVEGTVQLVSTRQTRLIGPSGTIAGYTWIEVRGTYTVLSGVQVWASARNLLDAAVVHWEGYPEAPFTLNIGMSYSL